MTTEATITPADALAQAAQDGQPVLCDVHGLAAMLAVSVSTVYLWRREGKLLAPLIESGRIVRWSRAEVRRWVDDRCPDTDSWRRRTRAGAPRRAGEKAGGR